MFHQAAKNAFDEMGVKKLPKVRELRAEYAKLLEEKKKTYAEYRNMAQIRKFLLCQFFILSGFPHFCPKAVKSSIGIIVHLKHIVSC